MDNFYRYYTFQSGFYQLHPVTLFISCQDKMHEDTVYIKTCINFHFTHRTRRQINWIQSRNHWNFIKSNSNLNQLPLILYKCRNSDKILRKASELYFRYYCHSSNLSREEKRRACVRKVTEDYPTLLHGDFLDEYRFHRILRVSLQKELIFIFHIAFQSSSGFARFLVLISVENLECKIVSHPSLLVWNGLIHLIGYRDPQTIELNSLK